MEYEYSYKVSDLNEYLNYCKNEKYDLISDETQTRTIYRNDNGTIARITKNVGNETTISLDFKEDDLSDDVLKVRRESKAILIDNIDNCENILDFLSYKKDNSMIRRRYTYMKGNVKFEMDEYNKPTKCFVVAIEGDKEEVDKVYLELSILNEKYLIK